MAVTPVVPGYTDYSSTGPWKATPVIYASKTIENLYPATVFSEIASTDYEGEIKGYGDNIIIRVAPSVVVSDYQIGSVFSLDDYQTPQGTTVELPIDKAKKFLIKLDTVNAAQSDLDLADQFTEAAGMQMAVEMDKDLLNTIPAQITINQGTTAGKISASINLGSTGAPVAITAANIIDKILDLGLVLDEADVSRQNRWLVIPAWAARYLKSSDLRQAYLTGDSVSPIRNGKIGMIDDFTIYSSNQLTTASHSTYYDFIAGDSAGLAWASQIQEANMESMGALGFGSVFKGLAVYGFKVIDPKKLALGRFAKA